MANWRSINLVLGLQNLCAPADSLTRLLLATIYKQLGRKASGRLRAARRAAHNTPLRRQLEIKAKIRT